MNRGDLVYLKRHKRLLRAQFVDSYLVPPAVRVMFRGQEKIVAKSEIVTPEERQDSWEYARREFMRKKYN